MGIWSLMECDGRGLEFIDLSGRPKRTSLAASDR